MFAYRITDKIVKEIGFDIEVKFVETKDAFRIVVAGIDNTYFSFIDNHPYISIYYVVLTFLIAYLLARLIQHVAEKWAPMGKLLYGPLAPLLVPGNAEVIICYVLTKISNEERRLIYGGKPIEVNLRDGSKIDHIVLQNPTKFYLRMNKLIPKSTQQHARSLSGGHSSSVIYISGDDIENVHFESWLFPSDVELPIKPKL